MLWAMERRHGDPVLEKMFKAQGIEIIPRAEGAQQVATLLTLKGKDRAQILVGNWALPPNVPAQERETLSGN